MADVREATPDDIPALARLRGRMFDELAGDFGPAPYGDEWQDSFETVMKEQLAGDTMRVVVVDGDDGPVSCGVGVIDQRLPSPYSLTGRTGYVFGIITEPAYRRRGHARAIMEDLLAWFDEHGLERVDLHAAPDGRPLYYSMGFTDHPEPTLSRKRF
jgi:ribosomal protein S18 acetylase RimI-like enzyme